MKNDYKEISISGTLGEKFLYIWVMKVWSSMDNNTNKIYFMHNMLLNNTGT